jgi:hypothetical protein
MKSALPFLKAFSPKFKGEIWENARRFQLVGAGYKSMPAEQNGYFDISTANHLRGVLKALNDPDVRVVLLIGATQCLKSVAGDIWIVHLVEHESDSILCLFEDDPKAKLYSDTRCMDTVKNHAPIAEMISDIIREDSTNGRHKVTNTQIKFAGSRLLKICGLNDGNVSSLSWRFVWVSEAWQHKSDGLLKKAIRRADRYADNCKIFIESQAGLGGANESDGEDLYRESLGAHRVPLTWACPYCGGRQSWECDREYSIARSADFTPIRPTHLPAGQLELWSPPKPGTLAGMNIPPADAGNGEPLTLDERARRAKWECYWCGTLIADTPSIRRQISESYDQDYRLPAAPGKLRIKPKQVCFIIPRESNVGNSFESGALSYLKAKEAQESGNEIPLQDWYMSERAVFYTPRLTQTKVETVVSSVALDEKGRIPNEAFRTLVVDCQKDLVESLKQGKDLTGHFWYVVCANDKAGNTTELQWGYATSWEQLFGRVTLDKDGKRVITGGIKNKWNIPTRNVCVDASNWLDIVKEKAAHYRTIEAATDGSGKLVWATWKLMWGDDGSGCKWPDDGVWRSYWPPKTYVQEVLEPDGKWIKIKVQAWRWSNLAAKQILFKMRLGLPGQPKIIHTPAADDITRAKAIGQKSYDDQMNGFAVRNNERTGKPEVTEFHKEQHLVDCHCENIVLKMMHGTVRGEAQASPGEAQEARQPAAG